MDDITDLLGSWKRRLREEADIFLAQNEDHLLPFSQCRPLRRFLQGEGDPESLENLAKGLRNHANTLDNYGWEPKRSEGDAVHLPPHYNRFPYEPVKFIVTVGLNYLEANVVKYLCRYPHKNGTEDIRKAARSMEMLARFNDGDPQWST